MQEEHAQIRQKKQDLIRGLRLQKPTQLHQGGRFYRLSTGRAAHCENIKPHNVSSED